MGKEAPPALKRFETWGLAGFITRIEEELRQNNAWSVVRRASALFGAAVAVFAGTAIPVRTDARG